MSLRTEEGEIDWAAMHARIRAAVEGLERGFEPDAAEVQRRLRERAERLARVDDTDLGAKDDSRLLEFEMNGRRHAVESRYVREVCAGVKPTRVPQAPGWATGVLHLRGEILTVLDFQALVGAGRGAEAGEGPLLILHGQGRAIAMATDRIHGLRAVARASLDPVPGTVQGNRRYYLGVTEQDALVLDAGVFFDDGVLAGTGADGSTGTRGSGR